MFECQDFMFFFMLFEFVVVCFLMFVLLRQK